MRSRLLSSALWSLTGNGAQYGMVFLLLLYLARVLDLRDFGLMATVSVGLDLGTRVARWGQVELLQQKRYLNDDARNQSFRLSLGIGALFALLFVGLAQPMARYFHSAELATMMYLCAPVFLFLATGSTAEAVLRAQFRFRVLAFRSTIATLVGAVVAIVLANNGYGALALAAQRLIQAAMSGLWIWSAVNWRPSLKLHLPWSSALAREGATVMAGTLLPVAIPRTIDLIVGFTMGPVMLGIMRVAFRVNEFVGQLVIMPLVSVANAELSTRVHDRAAMVRSYLRLTQASALLMNPLLIGLALVAPEAVPFLFGPKWVGAVPFVEVVGLLAIVAPINYYFAPAMVALGQSRLVIRQGLVQIVLGAVLTAAAAQISLVAIAWAHVVRGLVVSMLNIGDLHRHMNLRLRDLARSMAPPYLATLGMTVAVLATRSLVGDTLDSNLRLALLVAIGGAGYAGILALMTLVGLWPDFHKLRAQLLGKRAAEPLLHG